MRKKIVSVVMAATAAMSLGIVSFASDLGGKYIVFVPDSVNATIDETHVSEEYSGDGYKILLYNEGESVNIQIPQDEEVDVKKYSSVTSENGTSYDSFTERDGNISFEMPASDLYLEAGTPGNSDSTEENTETDTDTQQTENIDGASDVDSKDISGLAALNVYIPENTEMTVNMVSGETESFTGPHIFRTDNHIADFTVSSTDGETLSLSSKKNGKEFEGMGDILSVEPQSGSEITIDPINDKTLNDDAYEFDIIGSGDVEQRETEVTIDEGTVIKGGTESEAETEADQEEANEQEDLADSIPTGSIFDPKSTEETETNTAADDSYETLETGSVAEETEAAESYETQNTDEEANTYNNEDDQNVLTSEPNDGNTDISSEAQPGYLSTKQTETEQAAKAPEESVISGNEEENWILFDIPSDTTAQIEMKNGDGKTLTGPYTYKTNKKISFARIYKTEGSDEDVSLQIEKDGQEVDDASGILSFDPVISDEGMIVIGFKQDYSLDGTYQFKISGNDDNPTSESVGELIEMEKDQGENQNAVDLQSTEIEEITGKTVRRIDNEQRMVKVEGTLNVRDIPSAEGSETIHTLYNEEDVIVTGITMEDNPWYRITFKDDNEADITGYVLASYISD